MSECDDVCLKSKVHAECSRSVVGGLRWPASTTDAGDARYRDSNWFVVFESARWTYGPAKKRDSALFKNVPRS